MSRVRDPLGKSLLHVGPDSMRSILPQTPMALLVVKEQVSNSWAIYLHMFQLPQNWVTLNTCITIPTFQENAGDGADQGSLPLSPPASWRTLLLGSHPSFPQHLQVHQTAPAWKIVGPHPMTCTPLGHLGNTFLPNLCAYWDLSQVHNSYQ